MARKYNTFAISYERSSSFNAYMPIFTPLLGYFGSNRPPLNNEAGVAESRAKKRERLLLWRLNHRSKCARFITGVCPGRPPIPNFESRLFSHFGTDIFSISFPSTSGLIYELIFWPIFVIDTGKTNERTAGKFGGKEIGSMK